MITAKDLMDEDAVFVLEYDPIVLAARKMRDAKISVLPVVTADGALTSQLTVSDIVTACVANGANSAHTRVCECTSASAVTVQAGQPLAAVLRAMTEHQTERIPVLDGDRFLGVSTYTAALAASGLPVTAVTGSVDLAYGC